MTALSDILASYKVKRLPYQEDVITQWKAALEQSKENPQAAVLSDDQFNEMVLLVCLAVHHTVLLDYLLPQAKLRDNHDWLACLVVRFIPEHSTELGSWIEMVDLIGQRIDLPHLLVEPTTTGASAWDLLLFEAQLRGTNSAGIGSWTNKRIAALFPVIEKLPDSVLARPHFQYPQYKNKDVWLWQFCASPFPAHRQGPLSFLLAKGADPNTALEMECGSGQLSAASALLMSRDPDKPLGGYRVAPGLTSLDDILNHYHSLYHSIIPTTDWIKAKYPESEIKLHSSLSVIIPAMRLLHAAGMTPSKQLVNHPLRLPTLVLYDIKTQKKNGWSTDELSLAWWELMSMGFPLSHESQENINLLVYLALLPFGTSQVSLPTNVMNTCKMEISSSTFKQLASSHALTVFTHSPRASCVFFHQPRVLRTLLSYLANVFSTVNPEAAKKLSDLPEYSHPISQVGQVIEDWLHEATAQQRIDVATKLVNTFAQLCLSGGGFTLPQRVSSTSAAQALLATATTVNISDLTHAHAEVLSSWLVCVLPNPTGHFRSSPDNYTTAERNALDDLGESDPRPAVLLYTEANARQFHDWASQRLSESEGLKSRLEKIYKLVGSNVVLPSTARRLALAAPALAAIANLRAAFPHFEEIIDLIHRHLILETRGEGSFSLPPLLMAGPPGTGKTFFFQELAAAVSTHYSMLSMEGVSGGFSIVGLDYGWANAGPGVVYDTLMSENATANPIILLDELDKAIVESNHPVAPVLLPLLEPHSARRFTDRSTPLIIDASHICWVATANDLSRVSAPIKSRFEVLHVPQPDYRARRAMAGHIYTALRNKNSWGATFDETLSEATLEALAAPVGAARDLRKNISQAFAGAAAANRCNILPQDIPASNENRFVYPWDKPLLQAPLTTQSA